MNNPVSRVITVTTVIDGQNAPYDVTTYGRSKSRTSRSGGNLDTSYGTDGWGETAPQPTTTYPYIWRRIQHYNSEGTLTNTSYICDTGATGDNGDSAWSVQASRSPLIINQSRSNTSDFGLPIEITFTGMNGNNAATVGNVTEATPNTMGLQITGGAGKITINSYSKVNNQYVTSGAIVCTVPLTYNNVTQNMTVAISVGVNLLGEFKREIDQDIETAVGQVTEYLEDEDGNIIRSEYLYEEVNSAQESITTMSAKINNGKNLLSGVLTGTGWKSANSGITPHDKTKDVVDNWIEHNDDDIYVVSPSLSIKKDVEYTLAFDVTSLISGAVTVKIYSTSFQLLHELTTSTSSRRKVSFTPTANNTVMVYFQTQKVHYPQLEIGSVATDFEANTKETVSQIKQTADEIDLGIRNGLARTGINISDNTIKAQSNNFTIRNNVTTSSGYVTRRFISNDVVEAAYGSEQTFGIDTFGAMTSPDGAPIQGAMLRRETEMLSITDNDTVEYAAWFKSIFLKSGNNYTLQTIRALTDMIVLYTPLAINRTEPVYIWMPPAKDIEGQELTIVNAVYNGVNGSFPAVTLHLVDPFDYAELTPTWAYGDTGYGFFWPLKKNGLYSRTYNTLNITDYSSITLRATRGVYSGIGGDENMGEWVVVNAIKRDQ